MDEDLGRLLSDPFQAQSGPAAAVKARGAPTEQAREESVLDLAETGRAVRDHTIFRGSVDVVLRPHVAAADELAARLGASTLPTSTKALIANHAGRLKPCVENIKKKYRIYVETADSDTLEKEAKRMERRFFSGPVNAAQLDFLKLRRYYEKIRTFEEFVREDWREMHRFVDTLGLLPETRMLARQAELELLKGVHLLLRQTDSFLDAIKLHMRVQAEERDAVTGGCKITVSYDPGLRYTIAAVLGQDRASEEPAWAHEVAPVAVQAPRMESDGSIARNIVLETRERRLNSASILSVPLLGSRDWNRSRSYTLEVPVKYYDECVENFKKAYHVNLGTDILQTPLPSAAAQVRSGAGAGRIPDYAVLLAGALEELADDILTKDFPGTEKPAVFVYHCGPMAFYNMLMHTLRQRRQGEIFYLDQTSNTVRELPDEVIRKGLIDWWTARFSQVSGEDVDSYLTYSRCIEMVKKDYRMMRETGLRQHRKEQTSASYAQREKWMKDNQVRVFGIRKLEIFKRFLTGTLL